MSIVNGLEIVRDRPQTGRKIRSPNHAFDVTFRPWVIQPFMIAPVLPGETMSNLLIQGTVHGDALRSQQHGWWHEVYFFYVKHRDLDQRDLVTKMHLDITTDVGPLRAGANNRKMNAFAGGVDWARLCLKRVVEEYFRDEGDAWDCAMVDGLPCANVNVDNFLQSAKNAADMASDKDELLPGEVRNLPDQGIPAGFETAYAQWQHMRGLKLFEASFEDYLKSFGVKPAKELEIHETHRPELLRYLRDWGYPQVKFDVNSGAAAPLMNWNVSERADKDRFFNEPGFIFGVTVCRPKVLMLNVLGAGVGMLDNAYAWLPAVLDDAPYTSLKQFPPNGGPIAGATGDNYWVDVKDLFMHGDQWFTGTDYPDIASPEGVGRIGLPDGAPQHMNKRYLTGALYDQALARLFKDKNKATHRFEGVAKLSIKSLLRDTSL